MTKILEEIETRYPVGEVRVNGRQVWPYLRSYYASLCRKEYSAASAETEPAIMPVGLRRFIWLLTLLRDVFYGFRNWFSRYEYVVLAHGERKIIDGCYVNRLLDPIIDHLGMERALLIENVSPHYPIASVHTRRIVSMRPLLLLMFIITRMRKALWRKHPIENKMVLERIELDYCLAADAVGQVEFHEALCKAFKRLFRAVRPRVLFLTCYYGNEAAVRAAKDLGIIVVEVQHGVIVKEHPAYSMYCDLDRACFPDHLLVFGKREQAVFENARFIEPGKVHPVGSYIIDHTKESYRPEPYICQRLSGYKKVVGITLQWIVEKRLNAFICEAAQLDGDIFYMLIPRQPENEAYASMELPANVAVIRDRNFYQLMAYADFHCTVFSTCALEAPSLGVRNILVDIDGLARAYYETTLTDTCITRFVSTPKEFVETINTFPMLDRDTICKLNEDIIVTNYRENIRRFLREYIPGAGEIPL